MNIRQKLTLSLLLTIVVGSVAFAQVVDIPDPRLRAAIRDDLILDVDDNITQTAMRRLVKLVANERGIESINGLEFATNLQHLQLRSNHIVDIRPLANLGRLHTLIILDNHITNLNPLANLTELIELNARENTISDVSPLANLRKLKYLDLSQCNIMDIGPLAGHHQLEVLQLNHNRIVDVHPIADLIMLNKLEIHVNFILDHRPLNALTLDYFRYDQTCEMPSLPLKPRLEGREFPSVVAAFGGLKWGGISNKQNLSVYERFALHDLWFSVSLFNLRFWHTDDLTWKITGNMDAAIEERNKFIEHNPNMVFLEKFTMREDLISTFGEDWPYWVRDANGNIASAGWREGDGLIDFTHPDIQEWIVQRAIAVSKCGLYDGIMFDWWTEEGPVIANDQIGWTEGYRGTASEQRARDNIIQRIRAETRPDFLIAANVNRRKIPRTGPYINGASMETLIPSTFFNDTDLDTALHETESTLLWSEEHLRPPRINHIVGAAYLEESPDSPRNLRWMRAMTTLTLTHSNGYIFFHHYWYDFWDADLGRPVGPKTQLYDEDIPGLYIREFTNGWAVYNHSGEAQVITLPEEAQGVASELVNTEHTLPNLDGEMYLRKTVVSDQLPVTSKNPADVNEDGVVNIFDLTLVAQAVGTGDGQGDVNGDGVVNVFDLVFVANQF